VCPISAACHNHSSNGSSDSNGELLQQSQYADPRCDRGCCHMTALHINKTHVMLFVCVDEAGAAVECD
jgi:hypothetical protein